MKTIYWKSLLGLAAVSSLPLVASADTIAYDNAAGSYPYQSYGAGSIQNWVGSLGLDFNVNSPIEITALGAFDNGNSANLIGTTATGVTVGIYNASTEQLVGSSVLFTPSSPSIQINGDAFLPTSLTLVKGSYTVVTFEDENYNQGYDVGSVINPTSVENTGNGLISFVGGGLYLSGSEAYPTSVDSGPANRYDAGTFEFTAVPDGGLTAGLLGGALIGIGALRRKFSI